MIEKNVGNIERIMRLFIGPSLGLWASMQPSINAIEWFVIGISIALIINGVFSRCYFWWVLDRNTRESERKGDLNRLVCSG
jgi:hypothetical protein